MALCRTNQIIAACTIWFAALYASADAACINPLGSKVPGFPNYRDLPLGQRLGRELQTQTADELIEQYRRMAHDMDKALAEIQAEPVTDQAVRDFAICSVTEEKNEDIDAIITLQHYKKCLTEQSANPRLRC